MLLESFRISAELGITADEVFTETVSAGWISFKSDWIKNRLSTGSKGNQKNADTGDFNAISNRMTGLFGNSPQPINAEVIS